jgi:putative heme-binding domain-containing protein
MMRSDNAVAISSAATRSERFAIMPAMRWSVVFGFWVLTALLARADDVQHGLRVPPGFEVVEFADNTLATDIFSMTLDPRGRVVVAGLGYVRVLVDENGAGRASRAITVAEGPKDGAQGLLWEGDSLFVTGDGGLRRYRIQGDHAVGPSELLRTLKTGGEHSAHDIKRGPDGWLYVLCGNTTGVDHRFADLPTSPIREPVAGCVLRFAPDWRGAEIVADGYRNAYRMDWNADGDLFTFDSDNERCVSLPWYEGTRFYHVIAGGHYGWLAPQRAQFWRLPPYFADVVAPAATLGRGSPTGVVCYRHTQFPERYRGGFFLCDWTFGRVYFAALQRSGQSYTAKPEIFLESVGDNGFAPTDAVVDPRMGDLFVCIGGRGTRGAVYRIRYTSRFRPDAPPMTPLRPRPLHARAGERDADLIPRRNAIAALPHVLDDLKQPAGSPKRTLDLLRTLQIVAGDVTSPKARGTVWEGYSLYRPALSASDRDRVAATARRFLSSANADIRREASRLLAMIEDDAAASISPVLEQITGASDPVEDIHYLIVLARLRAPRTQETTESVAQALLALDHKISARHLNRDRNWPLRMAELHAELASKDPALNAAVLAAPTFGRPDHALFTRCQGFDRRSAAERFLQRAAKNENFTWNADLVALVGELPEARAFPVLRRLWDSSGLEESILTVLAKSPSAEDRDKFLDGLNSPQLETLRASVAALDKLTPHEDATTLLSLVRCLRRLPDGREEDPVREQLIGLLRRLTGQEVGPSKQAWGDYFAKRYPKLASRLGDSDGVDVAGWAKRLDQLDWSTGDGERGRAVFTKASCASCHSGAQALGPDLHGIASRFSRADLFTAIVQPSKDVSPRYRTTVITTTGGKTYQGLVIYEAVDGTMLQTGPATTQRIAGADIAIRRQTAISLMPIGLLNKLTDREVLDLYAYLKSLTAPSKGS